MVLLVRKGFLIYNAVISIMSMEIVKSLLFIIVGAAGIIWAADRFTDGAASLARRFNISQMVVGLTVVAFGTSAPELFVSMMSALQGSSAMAVANVVGSNIFNVLCIGGVTAAISIVNVSRDTVRRDIPMVVVTSVLMILLCLDGRLSFLDGCLLMAGFVLDTLWLVRSKGGQTAGDDVKTVKLYGALQSVGLVLVGLAALVLFSSLFVRGASSVAAFLGVSETVIGLTIVAGGTSLPELATSVVAARKGQSALAIGNVIGSCIFNILLILGLTAMVCPMTTEGITWMDYALMTGAVILFGIFSYSKMRISRGEGWVLTTLFVAYMSWIIATA